MENVVELIKNELTMDEAAIAAVMALYAEMNMNPEDFISWALSVLDAEEYKEEKEALAVDQREFYDEEGNLFGYSFLYI